MATMIARRRGRVALVAVLVLAVPAGIAYATIPDPSGALHACMNASGKLRLIDPVSGTGKGGDGKIGASCRRDETALTWNQTGPTGVQGPTGAAGATGVTGGQGATGAAGASGSPGATGATGSAGMGGTGGVTGPQGATGATGAPGSSGVSGYEVDQTSASVGTGMDAAGTFPCPSGKMAVGGGFTDDGAPAPFGPNVFLLQSSPTADGSAWFASIANNSGSTVTVTLRVVCVSVPGGSALSAQASKPASASITISKASAR